ncbi:MAG TPA: S8 family serine peptidase [Actinomycetota bacterium]|nr:S8 family serine peptidase [Actinomycetota bacterium]
MRRTVLLLALASFAALMPAAWTAAPARTAPERAARIVRGDYVVVLAPSVDDGAAATRALENARGFSARLRYSHAIDGFSATLTEGQVDALERDPRVAFVTPDRRVHALARTPLAPGDSIPPGVRRIDAATATETRPASPANVAVIDTGIDFAHPDVPAVDGRNCVGAGPAQDDNGHGTHVAGTIAARNDGAGVTGVAPGTKVYAVKVLDATGGGTWSQIICGIDWVTSTRTDADPANDVAVANMSLGGPGAPVQSCSTTTDALHKAICASTRAGVTYVVAAGNDGWDFDYARVPDVPAAYPEVLTVTAMTDSDGAGGAAGGAPACDAAATDDRYAGFSNFAATTAGGAHTIAAPGTCVSSTALGGGVTTMSGTSMATPHVTGAVALCIGEGAVRGPCSGLTPAQVVARMRADAQERTNAVPGFGFVGDPVRPVSGRIYGHLTWARPYAAPTRVTAAPASTALVTGSLRSGSATNLRADDDSYYEVYSTSSSTYTSAWFGRFTGVSNALQSLDVSYRGKASRACSQTLWLFRWTDNAWVRVDARTAGASEVQVDVAATGALADYVSGTSGDGDVRVRVRCTSTTAPFYTSGDMMKISYLRP